MKIVSSKEDTSSCVGGTLEGVEDLEIIVVGVRGGEIGWGILCWEGYRSIDLYPGA